jgi:hypothetical protein
MANGELSRRIASLMASFQQGNRLAVGELIEILHPELRLAAAKMKGERTDHTWQPTVLVNELYLELLKIKALRPAHAGETDEKAAFLYLAAHLMKRLLVRHAQPLSRQAHKIEIPENACLLETAEDTAREVDDALCRLASIKPQLRTVVEMKDIRRADGRRDCRTAWLRSHYRDPLLECRAALVT